jgi:acyl-coenzyme A synthetase/AMP-(fatty) acid ligase
MVDAPLIRFYGPDDALAWESDGPRSAKEFLADVAHVAEVLPDRPAVLNLLSSRYDFLVGFAAAMIRGQVTLLPQSRAPETLRRIAADTRGSYCLTDRAEPGEDMHVVTFPSRRGRSNGCLKIPQIPLNQQVAIAFTSGSTGRPTPNRKTWGALISVAHATGARLGLQAAHVRRGVVATVPHQHMFGLEASVMLAIQHGLTMHACRPLFPEDIRTTLAQIPEKSLLISTPLHLRACTIADVKFPPVEMVLCATAPLTQNLAREAEDQFHAPVHEIFGFAEAGSVASRRTVETEHWEALEGVSLVRKGLRWTVRTSYLPRPVPFPDRIVVTGGSRFRLLGRAEDHVNVAGHRASLGDLTRQLLEIDGVQDGVFVLRDAREKPITRLLALVVAPGKTLDDIQRALRERLDPVFLPRPLLLVPRLPRNETGKLPQEALRELVERWEKESSYEV